MFILCSIDISYKNHHLFITFYNLLSTNCFLLPHFVSPYSCGICSEKARFLFEIPAKSRIERKNRRRKQSLQLGNW